MEIGARFQKSFSYSFYIKKNFWSHLVFSPACCSNYFAVWKLHCVSTQQSATIVNVH